MVTRKMLPLTRRDFTKLALSALPAASLLGIAQSLDAAESEPKNAGKPNSKVAGVQIGLNVPYSFGDMKKLKMNGEEVLENCLKLGISGIELRTQPVEVSLGAAKSLIYPDEKGGAEELRKW